MAAITAGMVKELRDKTNAGMMDCKAALKEADGDLEAAEAIASQLADAVPGDAEHAVTPLRREAIKRIDTNRVQSGDETSRAFDLLPAAIFFELDQCTPSIGDLGERAFERSQVCRDRGLSQPFDIKLGPDLGDATFCAEFVE